jgi:ankyrin repeat protein
MARSAFVVRGGLTALLYAADGGHALAVELLIAAGADFVSTKNKQG